MLDARPPCPVATPHVVADDAVRSESRGDQLADSAIAAVCKDAMVLLAERLDHGAAVMDRVVTVSKATTSNGDNRPISVAHEDLHVA